MQGRPRQQADQDGRGPQVLRRARCGEEDRQVQWRQVEDQQRQQQQRATADLAGRFGGGAGGD